MNKNVSISESRRSNSLIRKTCRWAFFPAHRNTPQQRATKTNPANRNQTETFHDAPLSNLFMATAPKTGANEVDTSRLLANRLNMSRMPFTTNGVDKALATAQKLLHHPLLDSERLFLALL